MDVNQVDNFTVLDKDKVVGFFNPVLAVML